MHLNSELALDLLDGCADASRVAELNAHLEACSSCGQTMKQWRSMHALLGRTHLAGAPEVVLKAAEAIFAPPPAATRTGIRQVIASLVFDSFTQPAFAGARGAADSRQVVLRADEFDVHVKIYGDPGQRYVIGQIFARDAAAFVDNAQLHLLRNGERVGMAVADRFGGFQFERVPQGMLSLQIDLPKLTVIGALNEIESA